jgi:hypothetical protein
MKRVVVLPHADLLAYCKRASRELTDTWCSRLAVCKLKYAIETAEDIDKEFIAVTPQEIAQYDAEVKKWEEAWLKTHAA